MHDDNNYGWIFTEMATPTIVSIASVWLNPGSLKVSVTYFSFAIAKNIVTFPHYI